MANEPKSPDWAIEDVKLAEQEFSEWWHRSVKSLTELGVLEDPYLMIPQTEYHLENYNLKKYKAIHFELKKEPYMKGLYTDQVGYYTLLFDETNRFCGYLVGTLDYDATGSSPAIFKPTVVVRDQGQGLSGLLTTIFFDIAHSWANKLQRDVKIIMFDQNTKDIRMLKKEIAILEGMPLEEMAFDIADRKTRLEYKKRQRARWEQQYSKYPTEILVHPSGNSEDGIREKRIIITKDDIGIKTSRIATNVAAIRTAAQIRDAILQLLQAY